MNKWFKFFSADYLVDGKMRKLTPCERSCWLTLLCLADTSDIPGEIKHLEEYDLMTMAGLDFQFDTWDETKGVLAKFEELGMLKRNDNGMITILNFRKRQGEALSGYERVKKYRMSKRHDNKKKRKITMITDDNGIEEKRVEEKRIDIKKETSIATGVAGAEVNKAIAAFKNLNPNYENLFKNKTQRKAIEDMIKKWGVEKVLNTILAAEKVLGEQYAPVITTPIQLRDNLGKLIIYYQKEKEKTPNIIKI